MMRNLHVWLDPLKLGIAIIVIVLKWKRSMSWVEEHDKLSFCANIADYNNYVLLIM